ncbi:MAG: serine/threonine protein kinase, partial [Planctomycetales bacterium]
VYLAHHADTKQVVSLKVLWTDSPETAARFHREMELITKLKHPNIIEAFAAGTMDEVAYIALEHTQGFDLGMVIHRDGPFSIPQALEYTLQIARGLACAHEQGIVHRNIQPAVIQLDDDKQVKIVDFGLARTQASERDDQQGLTQADASIGTPEFMAPEQSVDAKSVDHRADIYALGCTMFYLMSGTSVFRGETPMQVIESHHKQPTPLLGEYIRNTPRGLQSVFERMLAKKKEDRYQSLQDFIADLEAVIARMKATEEVGEKIAASMPLELKADEIARKRAPKRRSRQDEDEFTLGGFLMKNRLLASIIQFAVVWAIIFFLPIAKMEWYHGGTISFLLVIVVNACWVLTTLESGPLTAAALGSAAGGFLGFVTWYFAVNRVVPEFSDSLATTFQALTFIPLHPALTIAIPISLMCATLGAVFGTFGK